MPNEFDFTDEDVHPLASGGVAASQGVSPDQAATAVGASAVMPPSVGMRNPEMVRDMQQHAEQQAVIRSSPPVATWAASADPAHVAVSKDDFPALGRVGAQVNAWAQGGGPFGDIAKAAGASWQQLQTDAQRAYAATTSGQSAQGDAAKGSVLKDALGLLSSPFAAITEPLSHALAAVPLPANVGTGFAPNITSDPALKLAAARQSVNLAMFGAAAPEGGVAGAGGAGAAAREVPPTGPAHLGPDGRWNTTPEGFVADEAGNAVHFADQKAAGVWAMREGYASGTDQIFSPANSAEGGTFHAQQTGSTAAPVGDVPQIGVHPGVDAVRGAVAEADAGAVSTMQQSVAESQTHARSPEVMESFLAQQTGDQQVHIDPDKLVELAQQGHEPFPEDAQAILSAAQNGEEYTVPMSRYLARTAGQPFAEALNGASTFREGGTSVDAAKDAPSSSATVGPGSAESPEPLTEPETSRARTLAEDARGAVERQVRAQYLQPLVTDAKALGMTNDQFARYSEHIEGAVSEALDKLHARAYSQVLRERKPEWQAKLAQHSAEVEQELAQQPAVQARAYLAQGKGPLGEPLEAPFKLDRGDQLSQHGIDQGLPDRMFKRGGVTPDEAAEVFGYGSGTDLIRALTELHTAQGDLTIAQHMKAMVHAEAEARTRAELGFDLSPEALADAASEAVNGPQVTDFLSTELQALAKAANLPFNKAAIKAFAEARFEAKSVRDALNIRQMEKYVYNGGIKAEKALLKGDYATAFIRKQQQFIHHLNLVQAHKFAKRFTADQKVWKRTARELSLDKVAQGAVNQVKGILHELGVPVKANPIDLQTMPQRATYIARKNGAGADIIHAPIAPGIKPLDMQVSAYTGVSDMIRSIMKAGKQELELGKGAAKRDLEEEVDLGVHSLSRYTRTITERELTSPNMLQKIDAARRSFDAWMVRQEQMMRDFGARDPDSPFFRNVTAPIQERKGWSNDQRVALAKHFHALDKAVGPGFSKWMKAKTPVEGLHTTVKTRDGDMIFNSYRDVMMAALHMGDEEALGKFAEGYSTTPATIEAIAHEFMTEQAWTAAQGIWDAFASLRPEIEKQYRDRTGVTPKLVESRPFTTPKGRDIKGGYFPVRYDMAKAPKEWLDAFDSSEMLGDKQFIRATPTNTYIKERTGVSAPMSRNFDGIHAHLNSVIHDLAYRDVLADANKFLLHDRMRAAIARKYGPEYVDKIRKDLYELAGAESANTNNAKAVSDAINYLTEAQMVNMIGYSPKTMLKHGTTAVVQAMREVGPARYSAAMFEFLRDPIKVMRDASDESAEIRHILSSTGESSYDQFLKLTEGKTTFTSLLRSFAFHMVGSTNKLVAIPLYNASKLKLQEEHPTMPPAQVQAAAEQSVRQALGSAGRADSSASQRMGKDAPGLFYGLTNRFLTFLNHMYNKSREIPQDFGYAGDKVDIARGLGTLLTAILIPTFIDTAVDKGTFDVFHHWAIGLVHQLVGPVPGLNEAVGAGMKKAGVKDYPGGESMLTSIGEQVGNNFKDLAALHKGKHFTNAMVRRALITTGTFGKLPGAEFARLEGFLNALREGKEHGKSWDQVLGDLIYGPKEKH